jgi:uncharacterized membrane protein YcaP (DUF421 family)
MWSDLFISGVPLAEKAVRTVLVYLFLLLGLRLAGKREMSQLNSFDLVVLLLLSNTVQNALIGNDNSLLGGVFGAAVLLVANALLLRTLHHYKKLDAVEGKSEVLIKKGRLVRSNLDRELITVSELEAAARRQGIESLAHVDECRLETGGALSFVQKHPTQDEERHHEVVSLLAQVQQTQRKMLERIEAVEKVAAAKR